MHTKIRIVFLIRSLGRGGAERQLAELATRLDPDRFDVTVLTFYPGGGVWDELVNAGGIRVDSLNKGGRWDVGRFALRLAAQLRRRKPTILHTYLVEPSVFGLVVGRLVGVPLIVWGVRASNVDFSQYDWIIGFMFRVAARLSRFADLMIANSDAGRTFHLGRGYSPRRSITVPNGIDTGRFSPSETRRATTRASWGAAADETLIGLTARLEPIKGHEVFLQAAQRVLAACASARFVCVGSGAADYAAQLRQLTSTLSIDQRVLWLPEHARTWEIYPAFDIGCSASYGEGFSNVVGEAMACGVPCVVTDCGDSSQIVGDTGAVVPCGDPDALAAALIEMIRLGHDGRVNLGQAARQRIVDSFGVDTMVARTAALYVDSAERQRAG
jgi:glycosyltransferase involved in cell wall biosynthesis